MKWKLRTIRGQLIFAVVATIVIFTLLFSLSMTYFQVQRYQDDMIQIVEEQSKLAVEVLRNPLWDYDVELVENVAYALFSEEKLASIHVYDHRGTLIVDLANEELLKSDRYIYESEKEVFFESVQLGRIHIAVSSEEGLSVILRDAFFRLMINILQIVVMGAILMYIASGVTKPIRRMEDFASKIAEGKLDNDIRIEGIEEVRELAKALQKMQDRIQVQQNDLSVRMEQIKGNYKTTVIALANAIEASDEYTRGHCDRVRKYSLRVAEQFGFDEKALETLEYAAVLHDIGKIGVSVEVLNKPGRLTDKEYEMIKQHPQIGYDIIKDVSFLQEAAEIIYQHHEGVDGKGYPRALKQEEILLASKILTVADAFDAMTSIRPYREIPMTRDEAFEELKKYTNRSFDGEVVAVFIQTELETEKLHS